MSQAQAVAMASRHVFAPRTASAEANRAVVFARVEGAAWLHAPRREPIRPRPVSTRLVFSRFLLIRLRQTGPGLVEVEVSALHVGRCAESWAGFRSGTERLIGALSHPPSPRDVAPALRRRKAGSPLRWGGPAECPLKSAAHLAGSARHGSPTGVERDLSTPREARMISTVRWACSAPSAHKARLLATRCRVDSFAAAVRSRFSLMTDRGERSGKTSILMV